MKTLIIVIVVVVIVALIILGYFLIRRNNKTSNTSSSSAVETASVEIRNSTFNPSNIIIDAGATVSFINNDSTRHTITSDNGSFTEQSADPGQTASITIPNAGSYPYHCSIHPSMTGSITAK